MVNAGKREDSLLEKIFFQGNVIRAALARINVFQTRSGVTEHEATILNDLTHILEKKDE